MYNIIKIFILKFEKFGRAIDAHSLIGNMGGYVGLLLGFSILQVPGFVAKVFEKIRKSCREPISPPLDTVVK